MAVRNSSTFDFSELRIFFERYGVDVMDAVYESIDEVSKEAVKRLKKESAAAFGNGDYSKGWTRTVEKGRLNRITTIHGKKPTYSLAHLLENGHAKRGGGRVSGRPHISTVEAWAIDEAVDRTIQKLESI